MYSNLKDFIIDIHEGETPRNSIFWIRFGNYIDDIKRMENTKYLNSIDNEPNMEHLCDLGRATVVSTLHYYCSKKGLKPPSWIMQKKFILKKPYFSMDTRGPYRRYLLVVSPNEFKLRNMFVENNGVERV
jgi:hypothetical protein